MKKIITILLISLLAVVTASAEDAYKGQIHISRVSMYHDGYQVHLKMRVAYSTDLLNRGETLYVSPLFGNGDNSQFFSAMVFNGKSRKWRVRNTDIIVVADNERGQFHFDIEYIGRYQEWMQGASLCFASEEVLNQVLRMHYMDCIYTNIEIQEQETAFAPVADNMVVLVDDFSRTYQPQKASQARDYAESRKGRSKAVENRRKARGKSQRSMFNVQCSMFNVRSNLLYDAALLPNLGIEAGLSDHWTGVLNATGNWINIGKKTNWKMLTADVEGRYWLKAKPYADNRKGHHLGLYGAVYHYDMSLGNTRQKDSFSYGGGISYGYAFPIGWNLSLDVGIGIGYIGGKYDEYKWSGDAWEWQARKMRHYVGPTKAEAALVWHFD